MAFFSRQRPQAKQDGRSAETAFRLPSVGSGSAVPLEYAAMEKLFGQEGADWRVLDRIPSRGGSDRAIEMFILETRQGRRQVYFDVTEVLRTPNNAVIQDVVDEVMSRQAARSLTILLPDGPFLILYKTLDDNAPELTGSSFDGEAVMQEVLRAGSTLNSSGEVAVTLSVLNWVHILSITNVIEVDNLQAHELINDLRAHVEGALKRAGAA